MEYSRATAYTDPGGSGFRKVPLSLVRVGRHYEFDLYLKIRDTYRLFAAKGVLLTMDHLAWRRRRDMEFFVREEEWGLARKILGEDARGFFRVQGIHDRHKAARIHSEAMQSIRDTYKGMMPGIISDVERYADDQVTIVLTDNFVLKNLSAMARANHFTFQHSVRVGILATALLRKLMGDRLTTREIVKLSTGFFLHDIGMGEVPMEIVDKPGRLSTFEKMLIEMHPLWGRERIADAESLSREAVSIILSHHERSDGTGYPLGKRGDEIPLAARICTIVDAFEALTAVRPYRKPLKPFEALQTMYQEMAHEFDEDLFVAFVKLLGPEI